MAINKALARAGLRINSDDITVSQVDGRVYIAVSLAANVTIPANGRDLDEACLLLAAKFDAVAADIKSFLINSEQPNRDIQQYDIVQIRPDQERFGSCLLIVDEVRSWGVQGYISNGVTGGDIWLRLKFDDVEPTGGRACWVVKRE